MRNLALKSYQKAKFNKISRTSREHFKARIKFFFSLVLIKKKYSAIVLKATLIERFIV